MALKLRPEVGDKCPVDPGFRLQPRLLEKNEGPVGQSALVRYCDAYHLGSPKKTAARRERAAVGVVLVCFRTGLEANHLRHTTLGGRVMMVLVPNACLISHGKSLGKGGISVNLSNRPPCFGYVHFSDGGGLGFLPGIPAG